MKLVRTLVLLTLAFAMAGFGFGFGFGFGVCALRAELHAFHAPATGAAAPGLTIRRESLLSR